VTGALPAGTEAGRQGSVRMLNDHGAVGIATKPAPDSCTTVATPVARLARRALTLLVVVGWVFFRSTDLVHALGHR
jgi:hypothetical protein